MFHYRLIHLNKSFRILIAVLLSITIHLGLINVEFTPRPVFIPNVSLPRSVSIMLKQRLLPESQLQRTTFEQQGSSIREETPPVEEKPQLQAIKKNAVEPEMTSKSVKQSVVPEKKNQKSFETVERGNQELLKKKIVPAYQDVTKSSAKVKEPEKDSQITDEPAIRTELQTKYEREGTVSPGVLQVAYPRYQLNAPPVYPKLARKRGQQGTVILQVLVNGEGRVDELKIDFSSGFSLLDRAALTAVRKWIFEPGSRGGAKVPMWVRVPVTFKLKN
ncbi:MAG: energy transducer TonB [Deltaproteobacteria bacterium]|jgi:protein TonB|nr:energy transducer TonB [Deltaproteobacteria bacterium]